MIHLELARFLASRSTPAEFTLKPVDPDYCLTPQVLLTRDGDSFHTYHPTPNEDVEQTLRSALQHYPDPVKIQGRTLRTTPCPTRCHATQDVRPNETSTSPERQPIVLHQDQATPDHNVHCLGVSWHDQSMNANNTRHHILAENMFKHRAHLNEMTIHAFGVLPAHRLESLSPQDFQNLGERAQNGSEPELQADIQLRMERTLTDTLCPDPWTGEIWRRYDTPHPGAEDHFKNLPPIAVFGTPVSLMDTPVDPTQKAAAAHTMYQTDASLVPVRPTGDQRPARAVLIDFKVQNTLDSATPAQGYHTTTGIELRIAAEGSAGRLTIPAQAAVFGNAQQDASVHFVPTEVHRNHLEEMLFAAYFNPEASQDSQESDQYSARLKEQISQDLDAASGDPATPLRAQLQQTANEFHSRVAYPPEGLSATSQDGRITVSINPAP